MTAGAGPMRAGDFLFVPEAGSSHIFASWEARSRDSLPCGQARDLGPGGWARVRAGPIELPDR
jgi:hypothetical protein